MPKSSTSIGKIAQILQQDLELSVLALALLSKLESLVTWMLTVVCLCSGSQLFAWFVVIFYVILKSCVESKAIRIACVMPKMVRFLGGWESNFRARFWLFLHAWKNRCKKWFHEMFVGRQYYGYIRKNYKEEKNKVLVSTEGRQGTFQ